MAELSTGYNPTDVEQKWYKFWEENNLFAPKNDPNAPAFSIVIPPPNITGSLHMGHALNNSIQDLLIRYKRMCGFNVLWVPGTDHAGIATQNVVERELKKEGKRKEDLGREKFVEKIWEWKKEYGGKITKQLRRLGSSCDWSHERFTMDEGLSKAVKRHFIDLYREGLIYRGKRIINWCPRCGTALSDIEVEYETKKGSLWFIKYGDVIVATTRPETMIGDVAVAVNPKDERYKHLIGKEVILPLVGRKIPIIKDDFVDPKFGTGAVKVTPAHDPNDYEIGDRHNLPKINILTKDGKITLVEMSGGEAEKIKGIEGLDRFKAREEIVKLLQEAGLIEKIEDYENSVGHCYRCKTVIEPYLSDQWFVKIKPLAEKAIAVVESGEIKLVPERWTKVYLQWMTNLKDWCISRQLWWGHRIPAWYKGEEIFVGEEPPKGEGWTQDPDVFDTWFSSALWPFSVLGWPDDTKDLKTFYPTDVLVTSYDIIFFWVARMIMAGLHFMKQVPFKTVYFNALVKDIHGKKMSKSWGNVIDPLEVIDKAGADALRFAFISLISGQGQDVKLAEEKITEARNFANKIWNVARFTLMSMEPETKSRRGGINCLGSISGNREVYSQVSSNSQVADRWILSRYNKTIKQVTENIDNFQFGDAAKLLYEFIWSEFCDWYVEIAKIRLYGTNEKAKEEVHAVLMHILEGTLKLLHPIMPFITEELYQKIMTNDQCPMTNKEGSIMVQAWPKANESMIDDKYEEEMSGVIEIIRSIRNLRASLNIPHGKQIKLLIGKPLSDEKAAYIKTIAKVEAIEVSGKHDKHTISAQIGQMNMGIPIFGLVDFTKEAQRIQKDHDKLRAEIEKVKVRLKTDSFLKNATEGSIEKEKQKLSEYIEREKVLAHYLKVLNA